MRESEAEERFSGKCLGWTTAGVQERDCLMQHPPNPNAAVKTIRLSVMRRDKRLILMNGCSLPAIAEGSECELVVPVAALTDPARGAEASDRDPGRGVGRGVWGGGTAEGRAAVRAEKGPSGALDFCWYQMIPWSRPE